MAMQSSRCWSSKERVMAALAGQEPDYWPAITPTSVATVESMIATKAYFPAVHLDAHQMASLAAAGHDILGFDTVAPYFSITLEAAALGCSLNWGTLDSMPSITKSPLENLENFRMPPDLLDRPSIKALLEALRLLKKKYGDRVAIVGKVMGPWTLAYHLCGVQNFLLALVLEPDKVKSLLQELLRVPLKLAFAQWEAGADILTWADHATSDLVSASLYTEFLFPLHKKAISALGPERPVILHTCGWALDRLKLFAQTGFTAFHFDSRNPPHEALALTQNKILLIGGVNNPYTLLNGTPEDVQAEITYLWEAGIRLVAPECAVPLRTPNRNLKAIVRTIRKLKGSNL